jgi:hypothetical protein
MRPTSCHSEIGDLPMATTTNNRMKKAKEKLAAKRQQQIQSLRESKREMMLATRR